MTDHEKLARDIETLRESIRIEWQEVAGKDLSPTERHQLMNHIRWCANELNLLLQKFDLRLRAGWALKAKEMFGPMVLNPKRMGEPDEYAMLAEQIVDNDFLNGTTIRLDGGQRFTA